MVTLGFLSKERPYIWFKSLLFHIEILFFFLIYFLFIYFYFFHIEILNNLFFELELCNWYLAGQWNRCICKGGVLGGSAHIRSTQRLSVISSTSQKLCTNLISTLLCNGAQHCSLHKMSYFFVLS